MFGIANNITYNGKSVNSIEKNCNLSTQKLIWRKYVTVSLNITGIVNTVNDSTIINKLKCTISTREISLD